MAREVLGGTRGMVAADAGLHLPDRHGALSADYVCDALGWPAVDAPATAHNRVAGLEGGGGHDVRAGRRGHRDARTDRARASRDGLSPRYVGAR